MKQEQDNNERLQVHIEPPEKKIKEMSKPTALHTKGTAQVSEYFNFSNTAKKPC